MPKILAGPTKAIQRIFRQAYWRAWFMEQCADSKNSEENGEFSDKIHAFISWLNRKDWPLPHTLPQETQQQYRVLLGLSSDACLPLSLPATQELVEDIFASLYPGLEKEGGKQQAIKPAVRVDSTNSRSILLRGLRLANPSNVAEAITLYMDLFVQVMSNQGTDDLCQNALEGILSANMRKVRDWMVQACEQMIKLDPGCDKHIHKNTELHEFLRLFCKVLELTTPAAGASEDQSTESNQITISQINNLANWLMREICQISEKRDVSFSSYGNSGEARSSEERAALATALSCLKAAFEKIYPIALRAAGEAVLPPKRPSPAPLTLRAGLDSY